MKTWNTIKLGILALSSLTVAVAFAETQTPSVPNRTGTADDGALAGHRHRVVVSTDGRVTEMRRVHISHEARAGN